jgi:hypothetical protein
MAIKGAEYAVTRIVATLQLYLPTELDLIDAEMADTITLADVDNAAYYEYENPSAEMEHVLYINVNADDSEALITDTITNSPGRMVDEHSVAVSVTLKDSGNENPTLTKRRVMRYARAICRVLTVKYPTLTETVTRVHRIGANPMTYRLNPEQGEGQFILSAVVPLKVVTHESL